jgi:hypothetical protein
LRAEAANHWQEAVAGQKPISSIYVLEHVGAGCRVAAAALKGGIARFAAIFVRRLQLGRRHDEETT